MKIIIKIKNIQFGVQQNSENDKNNVFGLVYWLHILAHLLLVHDSAEYLSFND